MKKATKLIGLVIASAVCVTSAAMLAACTDDKPEKAEYTVTYYDGETVLDTQKVKEGEKATNWTPVKTDYTFDNWYATPNFAHLFDFDTPVTENKSAFAKFASSLVVTDTREFYICGVGQSSALGGSSQLKDAGKMTKTADKNEYTITVDLYENDWFQFVTNTAWDYQRGWGYIESGALNNVDYFVSGGSMGSQPEKKKDIKCAVSGNYTFTLTTHPADDMGKPTAESASDTITWKRNGDVEGKLETVMTYYLKGEKITTWKDILNPSTMMAEQDNGKYTLSAYLKEGDQFMFASIATTGTETADGGVYIKASELDEASKAYVGGTGDSNMTAKASGTYTFTYTPATETAKATLSVAFDANKGLVAADYYLDGTFGEGHNWTNNCFNDDYKFTETENGSGVYQLTGVELAVGTEFCIQAFKAGSTEPGTDWVNLTGNYNYRYFVGAANLVEAANLASTNYNFKVVTAGTYNITIDSYTKIVNIKSADAGYDIYIKGGMNGWEHAFNAQYKLAKSEADSNVYEITLAFEANWELGLAKYDEGANSGNGDWIGRDNLGTSGDANEQFNQPSGNLKCKTAGTYKVSYNLETGKIDFYAVANA